MLLYADGVFPVTVVEKSLYHSTRFQLGKLTVLSSNGNRSLGWNTTKHVGLVNRLSSSIQSGCLGFSIHTKNRFHNSTVSNDAPWQWRTVFVKNDKMDANGSLWCLVTHWNELSCRPWQLRGQHNSLNFGKLSVYHPWITARQTF